MSCSLRRIQCHLFCTEITLNFLHRSLEIPRWKNPSYSGRQFRTSQYQLYCFIFRHAKVVLTHEVAATERVMRLKWPTKYQSLLFISQRYHIKASLNIPMFPFIHVTNSVSCPAGKCPLASVHWAVPYRGNVLASQH